MSDYPVGGDIFPGAGVCVDERDQAVLRSVHLRLTQFLFSLGNQGSTVDSLEVCAKEMCE